MYYQTRFAQLFEVKELRGVKEMMNDREDRMVLKWFGYVRVKSVWVEEFMVEC